MWWGFLRGKRWKFEDILNLSHVNISSMLIPTSTNYYWPSLSNAKVVKHRVVVVTKELLSIRNRVDEEDKTRKSTDKSWRLKTAPAVSHWRPCRVVFTRLIHPQQVNDVIWKLRSVVGCRTTWGSSGGHAKSVRNREIYGYDCGKLGLFLREPLNCWFGRNKRARVKPNWPAHEWWGALPAPDYPLITSSQSAALDSVDRFLWPLQSLPFRSFLFYLIWNRLGSMHAAAARGLATGSSNLSGGRGPDSLQIGAPHSRLAPQLLSGAIARFISRHSLTAESRYV